MIAVEMGFSSTKVKSGSSLFSFSSAIVEQNSGMSFGTLSQGMYEFEGRKLLVGNRALARAEQDYKLELDWLIETAPLFAYHALTLAHRQNEDTIVVGLPPAYFLESFDRLRQRIYSFFINNKHCGFKQVFVVPQGLGSFLDYCSGNPPAESDVSLLVDIGANTINAMISYGEEVAPEGSTQFTRCGACLAANEVIAVLRSRDTTISPAQAHQILKSGTYNGEYLTDLPEILRRFARQTIDKLNIHFANHTFTRVILTGGGAALIKDYLPESKLANKFCFVSDHEFSNCRGYYIVGLSQIAEHNL